MTENSSGIVVEKPFAPACAKNRQPILEVLGEQFVTAGRVLEIGSGTGQHAVYFSASLPHLTWQPTDRSECLAGINRWRDEARLVNLEQAAELDVNQPDWFQPQADYIFSANTVHIMNWLSVQALFEGVGRLLRRDGKFCLYGPFNVSNRYTSQSNAEFDQWLKQRDPDSGIRNFEDLIELANIQGLDFLNNYAMPANNRILVWSKRPC